MRTSAYAMRTKAATTTNATAAKSSTTTSAGKLATALFAAGMASAAVGCVGVPEEEEDFGEAIAPSEQVFGIYALELETNEDSCSPERLTGELGMVDAGRWNHGLAIVTPYVSRSPAQIGVGLHGENLPAASGYGLTTGPGVEFGGGCGRAAQVRRYELIQSTTAGFLVNVDTEWTVAEPCDEPWTLLGEVPAASCHVNQDLRFTLLEACEAPCRLVESLEPPLDGKLRDLSCACD